MAGVSLSAVMGIPDAVGTFRYTFYITLPTGLVGIGTSRDLLIRCQIADLPGRQIEPLDIALHGQPTRHFRGRGIFQGTLTIQFIETMEGMIHKTLHQWMEKIVGTDTGNGNIQSNYSTNAVVNMLDPEGNPFQQATIFNIWPQTIPETSLDGSTTTPYILMTTWAYDWVSWAASPTSGITNDTDGTAASV